MSPVVIVAYGWRKAGTLGRLAGYWCRVSVDGHDGTSTGYETREQAYNAAVRDVMLRRGNAST